MDELIGHIVRALRENPTLDGAGVERIMRLHNGEASARAQVAGQTAGQSARAQDGESTGDAGTPRDTRPFTKRRLMPYFLGVKETNPDLWAAWALTDEEVARITALLQVKPRRTMSGVATITVITRPQPCRGTCIFCPTEPDMPKSYLSDEPACQRAVQSQFDPYLQVSRRLRALTEMGHPTGKVELIILGGTWDDYPKDYRLRFVAELFRALNEFGAEDASAAPAPGYPTFADLFALQAANAVGAHRCVGLVVETRPDCITPESLTFARALGATKIQMGVQSLDEDVLRANGRPMTCAQIERAFGLLRTFGFKSHVHVMLNLLGSNPTADAAGYQTLMTDPRFRPDEVKLYPCMLIRGAALEAAWREGRWVPYTHAELTDTLSACLQATPPWTRVSRMIRDFSAGDILAGDKTANLRQEVEAAAQAACEAAGTALQEMRAREIVRDTVDAADLQLSEIRYETATSAEVFLQWVTPENRLAGFLRLSLPGAGAADSPFAVPTAENPLATALIREVHVYGRTAVVGGGAQNAQHLGLGRALVERAAELAGDAGYTRLAVISAVGTRGYYEGLGFSPIHTPSAENAASLYQYRAL